MWPWTSAPTACNCLKYFSCRARISGLLISAGVRTCAAARLAIPATTSAANQPLLLRVNNPRGSVRRIRNHPNVGDESLNFGFRQSISVGSHERRLIESRSAVRDDRGQVGIAHLVQRIAFGERMGLDVEVVVIRDALGRGLLVVAAGAVLIVELAAERFLIAESDLFEF